MDTEKRFNILTRQKILHLNDPRCYDGAYYDAEYIWGEWKVLEYNLHEEKLKDRLDFWRDLNDYAVGERGESAKKGFKAQAS